MPFDEAYSPICIGPDSPATSVGRRGGEQHGSDGSGVLQRNAGCSTMVSSSTGVADIA